MALNTNRQRFVLALLGSPKFNLADAYMAAYGVANREYAAKEGWALLQIPEVAEAVEKGKAERLAKMELDAQAVLRDIALGVQSDGSELVEHVLDCCRYCHGDGHKYQFTPAEFEERLAAYLRADAERKGGPRDPQGLAFVEKYGCSIGYDPRRPPADDCPECFGRGIPRVLAKDTRFLSEAGRRAYAGAKYGKHGVEILTRDRDKALDLAAKHTGVAKEHLKIEDLRTIPDDELARRTAQAEHALRQAGALPPKP
jgi:hypothetical protein